MNIVRHAEIRRILEQLRDPQRRTWIMLNPTSIGDTAIVCAFARAFVRQHGEGIGMVVPPDHLPITKMFPDRFARVMTADRQTMMNIINNFVDPGRFEIDVPFCAHPYDHGDCRSDALMYLMKFPGRGGLSMTDLFRHLLRLPWSAALDRPTIPLEWVEEAQAVARGVGMIPGRSVILFPANSSPVAQFPDILWSTLVARLNERGYRVYCNMKGGNFWPKTMPIEGSIPIEIPVHLALPLVEFAGRTISGPNGMQFLTLLGGRFGQMSVMAPVTRNLDDYVQNFRTYSVTAGLAQYMFPETCVGLPFVEYLIPHDAGEDEMRLQATAVADCSTDIGSHVLRRVANGRSFIEEHADWLTGLVEPARPG